MQRDIQTIARTWRFLDHTTFGPSFDALQSFAYDDTFCIMIGQQHADAMIRTWVHHHTVVLGIQDSRLPHIDEGRAYLEAQGYRVIVRNSGGLAVMLDDGVLNLSLLVKEEKGLSIDAGYELMYELIKKMFSSFEVEINAYEIVGSYCPGSFDLSIGGKKFAGISQRRIRSGIAIQIYLCISGSGSERAEMIRQFYNHAVQGEQTKFTYPIVSPATMASLSELLDEKLTVADVTRRLLVTLQAEGAQLIPHSLTSEEMHLFSEQYERVLARNEKVLHNS